MKTTKLLTHSCIALLAAFSAPTAAQGAGSTEAIVEVCCAAQGITDARQRIELTVDDGDPSTPPTKVSVTLPKSSTSRDFANILCHNLQSKGIDCHTGESSAKRHKNKAKTTEAIYMDGQYTIDGARVEKKIGHAWQEDDGHLKVWSGDSKISRQAQQISYTHLDFSWLFSNAKPLSMEIYIHGYDLSDGSEVQLIKTVTYPSSKTMPVKRFKQIGTFLSNSGMAVSYPSNSQLAVDMTPAGIQIDEVYFSMWEDPAGGSAQASAVEYRFIVR